uniref:E3 ubiquitin-protein ligase n=1 Tax=Malurus cyaneus samueli TaxID=2593467 RepID=A0A8C5UBR2_9PASS
MSSFLGPCQSERKTGQCGEGTVPAPPARLSPFPSHVAQGPGAPGEEPEWHRPPGVIPPNASPPAKDCNHLHERLVTSSGYEGVLSPKGIKPELVGKLGKCGHMYHLLCLLAMYNNGNKDGSLQCPTCKPPGKMEFHLIPHSLPGYTDSKNHPDLYDIPTTGPEHPNPGKKFTARGFPRHLHLPATEKGRKVLKLLIVIHHKTEFGSNLRATATPTPTTCDNVLAELLAQGVSEATLKTEAGLGGALRPPRPCPRRRRLRRWTASPARRVLLPVPWAYRSCHPPVFPVCVFCPSVRPVRSRLAPLSLAS